MDGDAAILPTSTSLLPLRLSVLCSPVGGVLNTHSLVTAEPVDNSNITPSSLVLMHELNADPVYERMLTHQGLSFTTCTGCLIVSVMLLGLQLVMKAWMENHPGGESFQWLSRLDQGFQVREDQSWQKHSHSILVWKPSGKKYRFISFVQVQKCTNGKSEKCHNYLFC